MGEAADVLRANDCDGDDEGCDASNEDALDRCVVGDVGDDAILDDRSPHVFTSS